MSYKHGGTGDWHDVERLWVAEIPYYRHNSDTRRTSVEWADTDTVLEYFRAVFTYSNRYKLILLEKCQVQRRESTV